jgi:hypothetical protein
MKVSFTTNIDNLVKDLEKLGGKMLNVAGEKSNGYFNITAENLKHPKTWKQLKTFWALLNAMWATGELSYDCKEAFYHDMCLRCMRPDHYIYVDDNARWVYVKDLSSVPPLKPFTPHAKGISEATVEEATQGIQELMSIIYETGIGSKKIDEILLGMEENRRY